MIDIKVDPEISGNTIAMISTVGFAVLDLNSGKVTNGTYAGSQEAMIEHLKKEKIIKPVSRFERVRGDNLGRANNFSGKL